MRSSNRIWDEQVYVSRAGIGQRATGNGRQTSVEFWMPRFFFSSIGSPSLIPLSPYPLIRRGGDPAKRDLGIDAIADMELSAGLQHTQHNIIVAGRVCIYICMYVCMYVCRQ